MLLIYCRRNQTVREELMRNNWKWPHARTQCELYDDTDVGQEEDQRVSLQSEAPDQHHFHFFVWTGFSEQPAGTGLSCFIWIRPSVGDNVVVGLPAACWDRTVFFSSWRSTRTCLSVLVVSSSSRLVGRQSGGVTLTKFTYYSIDLMTIWATGAQLSIMKASSS